MQTLILFWLAECFHSVKETGKGGAETGDILGFVPEIERNLVMVVVPRLRFWKEY